MSTIKRPLKPCNSPMCPKLTRNAYCEDHTHVSKEADAERYRDYDKNRRDKRATAFYNSKEWERAREQALVRDHGLCQHCLKNKRMMMAGMVDHIIPIKINWRLRTALDNLQSLCNRCHSIKTAEDKRKYGEALKTPGGV